MYTWYSTSSWNTTSEALRYGTCSQGISVLPAHPHVHPQSERAVPAFAFQAIAGTHLPTTEGWKAELAWVAGYVVRQFTCPKAVTHPTTNRAQCSATALNRDQRVTATLNRKPNEECNADISMLVSLRAVPVRVGLIRIQRQTLITLTSAASRNVSEK